MDLRKKSKTANFATIAIVVCIVLVLVVGVFMATKKPNSGGNSSSKPTSSANAESKPTKPAKPEDVSITEGPISGYEASDKKNSEKVLSYRINSKPRFASGDSEGDVYIENPAENMYGIIVDYILPNDEVIYTSPRIKPNEHIKMAKLEENLTNGVYEATAKIYATDLDSGVILGYVEQDIKLYIGVANK